MKPVFFLIAALTLLFSPPPAFAHAFGQKYTLPIPAWLYIYGAAATLMVSFLIIGFFVNQSKKDAKTPSINISKSSLVGIFSGYCFVKIAKFAALALFLLTLISGLVGEDNSVKNFNMTFFWIIFSIGFLYLTAVFGNIWQTINPFKTIVDILGKLTGNQMPGVRSYPQALSCFPTLIFYFLFIWLELVAQSAPFHLSLALLLYVIANIAGSVIFGKEKWFRYEFFSVFFGLISKVSPLQKKRGKLYLQPPFAGLINGKAQDFSLLLFILFMLSSTAFDGFSSTSPWLNISYRLEEVIGTVVQNSFFTFQIVKTLGLLLSLFAFLYIYLGLVSVLKSITKSKISTFDLGLRFAFSLIPIAFAYNLAHYFTLLLVEGQNIIRLASDPFGFGWNIFGTSNFMPNVAIVGASSVWNLQVAFILIGHIVGVYIAHIEALNIFPTHKKAILSQFPMLVLMVIYTITGLWILSRPLTLG